MIQFRCLKMKIFSFPIMFKITQNNIHWNNYWITKATKKCSGLPVEPTRCDDGLITHRYWVAEGKSYGSDKIPLHFIDFHRGCCPPVTAYGNVTLVMRMRSAESCYGARFRFHVSNDKICRSRIESTSFLSNRLFITTSTASVPRTKRLILICNSNFSLNWCPQVVIRFSTYTLSTMFVNESREIFQIKSI